MELRTKLRLCGAVFGSHITGLTCISCVIRQRDVKRGRVRADDLISSMPNAYFNLNDRDRICALIKKLFGDDIKCVSREDSFSQSPNVIESISAQPAQFHHNLPSIDHFVAFLRSIACDLADVQCADSISYASLADSVAIDYDATTDTVTLSTFWSQPHSEAAWTEDVGIVGSSVKVEVGILSNEKAIDPEDLSLGGYLAVVGQDTKLSTCAVNFIVHAGLIRS